MQGYISSSAVLVRPRVFWFTGLSGSGKSTLSDAFYASLRARGVPACVLDGDVVRRGLCADLGFSEADRDENQRRVAHVAALMQAAGLTVLVATISPLRRYRDVARSLCAPGDFVEVYMSTPLAECERRDVKGLYKKARDGGIAHFTGISAPYEAPLQAEVVVNTQDMRVDAALALLEQLVYVGE